MLNDEVKTRGLSGKSGAICSEIERRLVRGFYKFGDEILANDLVNEFGASRAPVMAALNYLRAEGYLIITPQVGCRVIAPTPQEIDDFFFIAGHVEGAIAVLAAERHTAHEVELLRHTQQRIALVSPRKGEMVSTAFVELVAEFHQQLHQMSHSKYEAERASRYWRMSEFFLFNGNMLQIDGGEGFVVADAQRAAIVEAIAARDTAKVSKLMEAHVRGKPARAGVVG
jgi:GntR family transcriptional regulator, vanillate catabolism transcriptional regulator